MVATPSSFVAFDDTRLIVLVKSSGAEDPAAMNVAPATSSDSRSRRQMRSSDAVKKSSHTMATPRNRYRIASAYSTQPPRDEIQRASVLASPAQLVEAKSRRPPAFAEVSGVRQPETSAGKTPDEPPGVAEAVGNGALLPESPRTSAPTVPSPSAGASAASAKRLATTTSVVCLCVRRD